MILKKIGRNNVSNVIQSGLDLHLSAFSNFCLLALYYESSWPYPDMSLLPSKTKPNNPCPDQCYHEWVESTLGFSDSVRTCETDRVVTKRPITMTWERERKKKKKLHKMNSIYTQRLTEVWSVCFKCRI